jgi:hypothetical protein
MKSNIFLIPSSIIVSLIIVELSLILFWKNPFRDTRPSEIVELRLLSPMVDKTFRREWLNKDIPVVKYRTNKDRFILPINQHVKPRATVLFLGGSTTQCSYVQESLRFPALVSTILKKHDLKVNTINSGRAGNTLHDSINIFFNYTCKLKFKADYVILMHATNDRGLLSHDLNYHSRMGKEVTYKKILKWLGQSLSQIQMIGLLRLAVTRILTKRYEYTGIEAFKNEKPSDIDFSPFYKRLKVFVHMVQDMGAMPILMTQPLASVRNKLSPDWLNLPDQLKLNQMIRRVAKEEDIYLIDLSYYMKTIPDYENNIVKYLYDGIHVSDKGSIMYANHISTRLIDIFKKSLSN